MMENFDSVLSSNIEKIVYFVGKILQYNFWEEEEYLEGDELDIIYSKNDLRN